MFSRGVCTKSCKLLIMPHTCAKDPCKRKFTIAFPAKNPVVPPLRVSVVASIVYVMAPLSFWGGIAIFKIMSSLSIMSPSYLSMKGPSIEIFN